MTTNVILINNKGDAKKEELVLTSVVPVHNEEQLLEEQTSKLVEYLLKLGKKFEILFVENGSSDATLRVINNLRKRFDFIRLVQLEKADYSTAVIEGIKAAKGKFTIVSGIDFVDLEVIGRCFKALQSSDIVICSKNKGSDRRSLISRMINLTYNTYVRMFFDLKHSDTEGYQGYGTEKIQKIIADVHTKAHLCNLWILVKAKKANLTVSEVPLIVYEKRRSKFMRITRLPYLIAITLVEFIKLKCKGY